MLLYTYFNINRKYMIPITGYNSHTDSNGIFNLPIKDFFNYFNITRFV